MPNILIAPTTAAATSPAFRVIAGQTPRGLSAWGLAGAETITIYRDRGDGTFYALSDSSSTMTAGKTEASILASGIYQLVKTATASAAGASID